VMVTVCHGHELASRVELHWVPDMFDVSTSLERKYVVQKYQAPLLIKVVVGGVSNWVSFTST